MKGSLPLPLWTIAAPILAWLLFTGRRCCSARQSARPRYRDWRSAVGARGAGLVITRQRPGTATGVVFPTLENETGPINVVVWSGLFERERRIVLGARLMGVTGEVQREGEVVDLIAHEIEDQTALLGGLKTVSRDFC